MRFFWRTPTRSIILTSNSAFGYKGSHFQVLPPGVFLQIRKEHYQMLLAVVATFWEFRGFKSKNLEISSAVVRDHLTSLL